MKMFGRIWVLVLLVGFSATVQAQQLIQEKGSATNKNVVDHYYRWPLKQQRGPKEEFKIDTMEHRGNHDIVVINTTDDQIRFVRLAFGGNNMPWRPLNPPVGRTCPGVAASFDGCASRGHYAPLISVDCGYPIEITVEVTTPNGYRGNSSWESFTPKCGVPGSILWYNLPLH